MEKECSPLFTSLVAQRPKGNRESGALSTDKGRHTTSPPPARQSRQFGMFHEYFAIKGCSKCDSCKYKHMTPEEYVDM